MKRFLLIFFLLFCFIVPSHAVSLSHMSYVTTENFPTSYNDASFDIDTNFWFVFRDATTNDTTLVISSRPITGLYVQNSSTMPVVGESSIYYTSRQNVITSTYLFTYNSVNGSWDYKSQNSYFDTKQVEYPASYLYQSSLVNFYNSSGEVVFPGALETWNLPLGPVMVRAEVPAVRGMIMTVALFGVGLIALLMVLKLFGKPFRQFLGR